MSVSVSSFISLKISNQPEDILLSEEDAASLYLDLHARFAHRTAGWSPSGNPEITALEQDMLEELEAEDADYVAGFAAGFALENQTLRTEPILEDLGETQTGNTSAKSN